MRHSLSLNASQKLSIEPKYMYRCLELALRGKGRVAPNPLVGAVLVYNHEVIGEGYHEEYGQSHAEVNCIKDANARGNGDLISESTLYVSLEPCAHHGKTPPCTELIIAHQIPVVVIGCRDPFPEVAGKGIKKLEAAGVKVHLLSGEIASAAIDLNHRFFMFHQYARPWIILKWAQTADGFLAGNGVDRLYISNEISNRLVHKWRSEEAAILVGTNTALLDNPSLTNRLWPGKSPIRLVIDLDLKLPGSLKLFDGSQHTIVFNGIKHDCTQDFLANPAVSFYKIEKDLDLLPQLIHALHSLNIQSVIVEGGARLLISFIETGTWDEARIITNTSLIIQGGIPAPKLNNHALQSDQKFDNDSVSIYRNTTITHQLS